MSGHGCPEVKLRWYHWLDSGRPRGTAISIRPGMVSLSVWESMVPRDQAFESGASALLLLLIGIGIGLVLCLEGRFLFGTIVGLLHVAFSVSELFRCKDFVRQYHNAIDRENDR